MNLILVVDDNDLADTLVEEAVTLLKIRDQYRVIHVKDARNASYHFQRYKDMIACVFMDGCLNNREVFDTEPLVREMIEKPIVGFSASNEKNLLLLKAGCRIAVTKMRGGEEAVADALRSILSLS